ncbi:MAG: hypothetical protein V3U17_05975 [Thermoplasmata archaeon]
MLLPLLLGMVWRSRNVEIGKERVKVSKGLKRYVVRTEDIVAVFTTMMPKGKDFQEVLAIEFITGASGGILALDPTWGFDLSQAMAALQEALEDRWEEVYLGHKHASQVRGLGSGGP